MDKNIASKKEKLYQDPDDYTLKDSIMTDESKARIGFFFSMRLIRAVLGYLTPSPCADMAITFPLTLLE